MTDKDDYNRSSGALRLLVSSDETNESRGCIMAIRGLNLLDSGLAGIFSMCSSALPTLQPNCRAGT